MTVVLTGISVIAGGALAYVNEETKGPITEINERNLQNGIKQVILGSTEGELQVEQPDTLDGGYVLYQTDKGTAVMAIENGFAGPITLLVGFDEAGSIKGYTILSTSETPGLGVKAATWFQKGEKGDIIGRNPGEKALQVSKDGGDVDAITASTITSRAFLKAVNNAYEVYKNGSNWTDSNSGATVKTSQAEDNTNIGGADAETSIVLTDGQEASQPNNK